MPQTMEYLFEIVKTVKENKTAGIIVLLILIVVYLIVSGTALDSSLYKKYIDPFFPNSKITSRTLTYVNEYKIENVEDYYPGFASVYARTDNDELVWTKFRSIVRKGGKSHDHKIHILIEPSHLRENKCILIGTGVTPQKNDTYDEGWKYDYIVLSNLTLEQDQINSEPIILQPIRTGTPTVVFHAINKKRKYRGVLGSSCKDADYDKRAFPVSSSVSEKTYFPISEANAELIDLSEEENIPDVEGWAYVGIVFDNKWIEKHFEIDTSRSRISQDEAELEYDFPENTKIKATGMVNFRKNHIQYSNGEWINEQRIGTICEGQIINVHKLKRVALLEENGDQFEGAENDGFWWAKVSGNVNENCSP